VIPLGPAHRHGRHVHSHPHAGIHRHLYALRISRASGGAPRAHDHGHGHGHPHDHDHAEAPGHSHAAAHSHGLVDPSIVRSRAGIRAVAFSLAVLGVAASLQLVVYAACGSVALLADLVHNAGDALTAVPLGIAFLLRSARAERGAGLAIVLAVILSACAALYETVQRLLHPHAISHLWLLALAGAVGFLGNEIAAQIRLRAGRRLESPALIADGNHARIDGIVSLGVVASALLAWSGATIGDPIIGLLITAVILRISWASWTTVRRSRGAWDEAAGPAARRASG
jgi:Co/Zn/Cd efflux system component